MISNNKLLTECKSKELEALKNLLANFSLVTQKVYEDILVALAEKDVYIRHIDKILHVAAKFEKVKIKKGILNFSINRERCINVIWRVLRN